MNEVWMALRDPRVSTTLVFVAGVVVGLALIAQGYIGAADTLVVPFQVPFLVSGAVTGIAVVGGALALLTTHLERTEAAAERRAVAGLQREVLRLLAAAPQARERLHASAPQQRRSR